MLPLVLAASGPAVARADARADVPVVEIALLRSLPLFAALPPPVLEGLARALEPLDVEAGAEVLREGDPGDRYYAVAAGELDVSAGGAHLRVLGRGEGFGEIALLRGVTRTATVRARTASRLYALAQAPFLAAVTGHASAHAAAEQVVHERLAGVTIAP